LLKFQFLVNSKQKLLFLSIFHILLQIIDHHFQTKISQFKNNLRDFRLQSVSGKLALVGEIPLDKPRFASSLISTYRGLMIIGGKKTPTTAILRSVKLYNIFFYAKNVFFCQKKLFFWSKTFFTTKTFLLVFYRKKIFFTPKIIIFYLIF